MNDSLGDRMKGYENISRIYLTRRMPLIIRIDGCHFHTFTKGLKKPFDKLLFEALKFTTAYLCQHIQGTKLGYFQSDEISLLLTDYDQLNTDAWFDKNLQKIVSVSASLATVGFNGIFPKYAQEYHDDLNLPMFESSMTDEQLKDLRYVQNINGKQWATFDSRAFVLPKEEVVNYFIWRQQDATRNAIQGLGQFHFTQSELQNKNTSQIQDMLFKDCGVNFDKEPTVFKRGCCLVKSGDGWKSDSEIPIFTQDRDYIESLI
jgi:tRNA(His) 5'-end guanylyltransferase